MELAEFVSEGGIDSKPDFILWVSFTLNNIDMIIAEIKERTKRSSYNNGVQLLSPVQEVCYLDEEN